MSFIVLVTWTSDHSATVMWSIACRKGWQECLMCPCHFSVHVLMSCRIHVHGACARPDIHRLSMTCLLDRFRLDCLTHSFSFVHFVSYPMARGSMLSHIVMTVMCTLLLHLFCTCTCSGSPPLSCISPMYCTNTLSLTRSWAGCAKNLSMAVCGFYMWLLQKL